MNDIEIAELRRLLAAAMPLDGGPVNFQHIEARWHLDCAARSALPALLDAAEKCADLERRLWECFAPEFALDENDLEIEVVCECCATRAAHYPTTPKGK